MTQAVDDAAALMIRAAKKIEDHRINMAIVMRHTVLTLEEQMGFMSGPQRELADACAAFNAALAAEKEGA